MGWSGMAALGELAKGGGQYFGTLATEQIKAERLAQARATRTAERQEDRKWREEDRASDDKRADTKLEEAKVYSETVRDEGRAYDEEQDAAERGREVGLTAEANAEYDRRANIDQEDALEREERKAALKDGATSAGGKMTEGDKRLAMRSTMGGEYLDVMKGVISDGFDPSTMGSWVEKQANKFDITRGMTSPESQFFDVAGEGMVAGILRTDTGAAAPTAEQISYTRRLIPGTGESDEVRTWKIAVLEQTFDAMAAASMGDASQESIRDAALQAAMSYERANPMPTTSQKQAEFEPYQDEKGNWVKTPGQAENNAGGFSSDVMRLLGG